MGVAQQTSARGERLSTRFGLADPPTMSSLAASGPPVTYALLSVAAPGHRLGDIPAESAYSLQIVQRRGIAFMRRSARSGWRREAAAADTVCLFDLEEPPAIAFDSPFETLRCYVPRSALLDLAPDYRGSLDATLRLPPMGSADPLVARLGRALARLFDEADAVNQGVVDHLALTLQCHLLDTYGWTKRRAEARTSRLSAGLERRAKEIVEAQLFEPRPIAEMARECGLPAASFTRAFRDTTGRLPHQWAMDRRMDLARARLQHSDDDIATIAAACGFSQPGNFTRAFARSSGVAPAAWRRAKQATRSASHAGHRAPSDAGAITLQLPALARDVVDGRGRASEDLPHVVLSFGATEIARHAAHAVALIVPPELLAASPWPSDRHEFGAMHSDAARADEVTQGLIDALLEHLPERERAAAGLAMALAARIASLHAEPQAIAAPTPRPGRGLTTTQLRRVTDVVAARLDCSWPLSRLAAECGLSVGHFATAFAASMGLPPHRWITQQRLARATQLLREGTLPLADIALACGFSDQSHFTRVFAAATGQPPSRWRRSRG